MIKAVIIGCSHMHVNEVALYITEQPSMELVAFSNGPVSAEEVPDFRYTPQWNLENVRTHYCSNYYPDYLEMLDKEKPDIAFVLTENGQKLKVALEVIRRGIDLSLEKPMAMNAAEAELIRDGAKKAGVRAMVNWPVIWRPQMHELSQVIKSGLIGEPIKMHYLNGHTGPLGKGARHRGVTEAIQDMGDDIRAKTWWHQEALGGGVLLDIACYGCLCSKWFMGGKEKAIQAYSVNLNTNFGDTPDNYAAIIEHEKGLSVIEGTWTTPRSMIPAGPTVYGTEGVAYMSGGALNPTGVKACDIYGNELELPKFELGPEFKNMPWHYAHHMETGEPLFEMTTLDTNVEIMRLIDGISRSSASGKKESVG